MSLLTTKIVARSKPSTFDWISSNWFETFLNIYSVLRAGPGIVELVFRYGLQSQALYRQRNMFNSGVVLEQIKSKNPRASG